MTPRRQQDEVKTCRRLLAAAVLVFLLSAHPAMGAWRFLKAERLSAESRVPATTCDESKWRQSVARIGKEKIGAHVCADLRGDGVERMYAQLSGGMVVELELRPDGPHVSSQIHGGDGFPGHLAVIRVKGREGRSLLFNAGIRITEFYRSGNAWKPQPVESSHPAMTSAFLTGDFRGDGVERLYLAFQSSIAEYSPAPGGWRRVAITPNLGQIEALGVLPASGSDPARIVVYAKAGSHFMRWKREAEIAVLNFLARDVPTDVALAFSDLLRARVVQIANCQVLERQRIDKVMEELAFQQTGATDQRHAVEVGKLLNAEKIVMGSVGQLEGKKYASVNIVSVRTGEVENAEFVRWEDRQDLDKSLELLAQAACPPGAVLE